MPSYQVYENELVYAFLDINPVQPGHVLVVPKIEVDQFMDVPEEYYTEVFRVAKIIATAQKQTMGCDRVCTKVEGFDVPHFHYHLIPANSAHDFEAAPKSLSKEMMEQIQSKIASAIAQY